MPSEIFLYDIFFRIDEKNKFESLVIGYDIDGSINYIQYFSSEDEGGIGFYPKTGNIEFNESCRYRPYIWGGVYISLPPSWFSYIIKKTAQTVEFYFFSDIHYKKYFPPNQYIYADTGIRIDDLTFNKVKDSLSRETHNLPWRIWRITDINDSCINFYETLEEIVYDDSHMFYPGDPLNLLALAAKIKINTANTVESKLKLNVINQEKERIAKIRQHIQTSSAIKISEDVCRLTEPKTSITSNIQSIASAKILEKINQPEVRIRQNLIYEYLAGMKIREYVYKSLNRRHCTIQAKLISVAKTKIKQDITQVPEALVKQDMISTIKAQIEEDITLIPQIKIKEYLQRDVAVKIKEFLTLQPNTNLKTKVRTYNRVPTDYYDYYGIRTFGFLRS